MRRKEKEKMSTQLKIKAPKSPQKGRRQMKTTKEEAKFVTEFKSAHPIRETSGSGTGTFKWVRYLDGIDMRFGHTTKAGAERARGKAAREAWAMHVYNNELVACPRCGKQERRGVMEISGECNACMMMDAQ